MKKKLRLWCRDVPVDGGIARRVSTLGSPARLS